MGTVIAFGDAKAAIRFSAALMVETNGMSYWQKRFFGNPKDGELSPYPVQVLTDLEKSEGDKITYDLLMEKVQQPVEGDDVLENKEAAMKFYSDSLYIDQMRGGQNIGGRMSRKRTVHKLREKAKFNESKWWARVWDELLFMYASGARGANGEYQFPTTYTGFANNAFSAPDTEHIYYAGGAGAKASITSAHTMKLLDIEKVLAGAKMMNNVRSTTGTDGSYKTPKIQPIMTEEDGEEHYVVIMNPWQAHNLRVDAGTNNWMDYQKAAAGAEGKASKIFNGGLGMINKVIMHEHDAVVRFSDYGSGTNLNASRALFLGAQALVVAWGSPGNGMRLGWWEGTRDNGNQSIISTSAIFGINKVTYNGKDFGVYAIDSYAADPRS
jgi:N4-gp56 family major capsid protein